MYKLQLSLNREKRGQARRKASRKEEENKDWSIQ